MNPEEHYIDVNKESRNNRVDTHFDSEFYDVEGFLKGNTSLNSIELALLGDITGKKFCTCNVTLDRTAFLFHVWVLKSQELIVRQGN